jgi:unsaturated rhamnogalacturonyl hydrolase
MNRSIVAVALGVGVLCAAGSLARAQAPALPFSPAFERAAVLEVVSAAAEWQLRHPSSHPLYHWPQAAFYTGVMAVADLTGSSKYVDAMKAMGEKNQWRPGLRPGHADDYAVIRTYAKLYEREKDKAMLAPALALFDFLAARKYDEPLSWGGRIETREIAWCDALFMGPPAMAAVSKAVGDQTYLDLANRLWWKATEYLYDREEHLFYRDSRFFEQRERNGRKVFWSRGNGWVLAGLALMLQDMPEHYPDRPRYVTLFKEMAQAVAALQSPDGYWRASMLAPDSRPNPETSGTGFFIYGLAWGINQGILSRETYEPTVRRGWEALVKAVRADGMLGWVQPVGFEPGATTADTTEVYGTGALLLAGSEILILVKGSGAITHVPSRR